MPTPPPPGLAAHPHADAAPALIRDYARLFALVLPVTSVLLIPQIQGTTPGLTMALLSPLVVLACDGAGSHRYWDGVARFGAVFLFFFLASQFSLLFGSFAPRTDLVLIRPGPLEPMRSTLVTQGLYLVSGCLTFLFFARFYQKSWEPFVVAGGMILAVIGLLEWLVFLATGQTFGFLSNRTFGEGLEGSGSLIQQIGVMGHTFLRLKSLTGEPSMYSLSVLPYLAFCVATRRFLPGAFLFLTLLLSTSTSALLGFLIFGSLMALFYARGAATKVASLMALMLGVTVFSLAFKDVIVQMVIEKLLLENTSGQDRFFTLLGNLRFWLNSGLAVKTFGIGWGTVRSTDLFSTLLVNCGVLGLLCWIGLFLRPSLSVSRDLPVPFILNLGLIAVLVILLVAVPEYSYLTTWMFLGIQYRLTFTATDAVCDGVTGGTDGT